MSVTLRGRHQRLLAERRTDSAEWDTDFMIKEKAERETIHWLLPTTARCEGPEVDRPSNQGFHFVISYQPL